MRNNQNKRMRGGRGSNNNNNNNNMNRNKGQNPMTRVYESNGPDLKIRGTPSTIAEKYIQLARDAQSSGDPVAAENYYQHAEHYYRLIATAQEQFRQNNPQQFHRENEARGAADDNFDDGDDGQQQNGETNYGEREPQPYLPREAQQPFPQQQNQQPRDPQQQQQPRDNNQQPREQQYQRDPQQRDPQQYAPRPPQVQPPQPQGMPGDGNDIGGLPSFITGGAPQPQPQPSVNGQNGQNGQNGFDPNQPDRFPLHRRRRRHRGPRPDVPGGAQGEPVAEGD